MADAATKARQLADAVNETLGKKGSGPVVRLASDVAYKVDYIPTGLLPIDILLQGGMPMGRFVQLHGDFSTLKTYIGLNIVREVQKRNGVAAIVDSEHSFDPAWAVAVGVDLDNLIVERPSTGEEAFDIMDVLIRGGVDFILVDSVAATLPQTEIQKRLAGETIQPARLAQLMSTGLRRLTSANKQTSILWINQMRQNIGITFGSNEALPGGKALPYYASIIMKVRKAGKITEDKKFYDGEKFGVQKVTTGQKFVAEVLKSKLNKPFSEVWFNWSLKEGGKIDLTGFLIAQGIDLGLITQTGNTWRYGDKKAVGRPKFTELVASDDDLRQELEMEVRKEHDLPFEEPRKSKPKAVKKPLRKR